jgi:hypothetical protein
MLVQLRAFDEFFGSKRSLFPEDDELALGFIANLVMTHIVYVAEKQSSGDAHGTDFQLIGFIAGFLGPHSAAAATYDWRAEVQVTKMSP